MEDKLIPMLIGFICGLIVWTHIHSCIIKYKVNKLMKAIGQAEFEAHREIDRLKQKKKLGYFVDSDRIERLKMCQEIFEILDRAIHHL